MEGGGWRGAASLNTFSYSRQPAIYFKMLVFKKRQVDQEKMFRTTLQISIFKKKRLTKKYDFFFCYLFGTKMIQLWIVRGAPKKWLFQFFFRQFLHIILKVVLFSRLIFNLNLPKNSGQPKISFKIVIFKKRGGRAIKRKPSLSKKYKDRFANFRIYLLNFFRKWQFWKLFQIEWWMISGWNAGITSNKPEKT